MAPSPSQGPPWPALPARRRRAERRRAEGPHRRSLSALTPRQRRGESGGEKRGKLGSQRGCQEAGERKSRGEKTQLTSCCRAGDRQSARHMISDENKAVVRGSGQEPSARTSPPAALRTWRYASADARCCTFNPVMMGLPTAPLIPGEQLRAPTWICSHFINVHYIIITGLFVN